jgi:hypothetical protein
MTTIVYICDYCETEYTSEAEANDCENEHRLEVEAEEEKETKDEE